MPRQRQIDDSTLLQQATMHFLHKGYAGTSMRDLERSLGIKAPALYNRFGAKDALFAKVFEYYLQYFVDARIEQYLNRAQPLVGLREFFDTSYSRDNQPPYICLMVSTAIDAETDNAACLGLVREGNRRLLKGFCNTLSRAQQQGLLDSTANSSQLADYLLLCLQGLLVARKLEPASELNTKVDAIFSALPLLKTKE